MALADAGFAAQSAALDAVFGDSWLYQPFAHVGGDVNARLAPDPDRDQLQITGSFIDGYARAESAEARKQGVKPGKPGHASSRPQIDFDASQLPYQPRNGDRVVYLKTGKLYHVAEIKFATTGTRLQIDLNEIGRVDPTTGV